jgi:hypothetical protein
VTDSSPRPPLLAELVGELPVLSELLGVLLELFPQPARTTAVTRAKAGAARRTGVRRVRTTGPSDVGSGTPNPSGPLHVADIDVRGARGTAVWDQSTVVSAVATPIGPKPQTS